MLKCNGVKAKKWVKNCYKQKLLHLYQWKRKNFVFQILFVSLNVDLKEINLLVNNFTISQQQILKKTFLSFKKRPIIELILEKHVKPKKPFGIISYVFLKTNLEVDNHFFDQHTSWHPLLLSLHLWLFGLLGGASQLQWEVAIETKWFSKDKIR